MPETKKRRPGRPRKPAAERKRAPIGFRPTPTILRKLEQAAADNARPLSHEIEARLAQSFRDEDSLAQSFGGKHLMALMQFAGVTAAYVERQMGHPAHEHPATFRQVMVVVKEAMEVLGGQKMKDDPKGVGAKAIKAAIQFAGLSDQELTRGVNFYDRSVISLANPKGGRK